MGDEIVQAGETANLVITLDRAPNFEGSIQITIIGPAITYGYGVTTKPGERVYQAPFAVPPAAPPGTWTVSKITFTGGGQPVELAFKGLSFKVIPKPGLVFPSSAEVTINPSQTQLLRREAARLQQRIQDLKANLTKQANPAGSGVVELLRANTKEAFQALEETQSTFHKLAGPESQAGAAEIFFGDLRKSYEDVLLDLERERTRPSLGGSLGWPFLMVTTWTPTPQTRYPVLAQAVFRAFEQNELAYKIVSDSGTLVFDLDVSSSPTGATVSYRRRGDHYRQNVNPTNTVIKELPYAIWQVRFQKQGYREEEREHDPFRDPNHFVHVELQR
jgi:hypothetical protein